MYSQKNNNYNSSSFCNRTLNKKCWKDWLNSKSYNNWQDKKEELNSNKIRDKFRDCGRLN